MILGPLDKDKRLSQEIVDSGLINEIFYEHLFYQPALSKSTNENKSKTKESRAAAYSLLQKAVETLEPHDMAKFLDSNVWNLIKDMPQPKKWKYVPSENSRSIVTSQFVGLVNLGCICYMNSML